MQEVPAIPPCDWLPACVKSEFIRAGLSGMMLVFEVSRVVIASLLGASALGHVASLATYWDATMAFLSAFLSFIVVASPCHRWTRVIVFVFGLCVAVYHMSALVRGHACGCFGRGVPDWAETVAASLFLVCSSGYLASGASMSTVTQ